MGRRGLGKIERVFVGSTSKYCLEHAHCNVLIVKSKIEPTEVHTSLIQSTRVEEKERQRRLADKTEQDMAKQHALEEAHIIQQAVEQGRIQIQEISL
jgi:hypothetical protein